MPSRLQAFTSDKIAKLIAFFEMTPFSLNETIVARFVHMGITFDKAGELEVFNEKIFIFKAVDIAEEYVEDYGSTAIIFKKLILTAVIGGNEVQNPFVLSEVFTKTEDGWKLAAETFTRIATDFDAYKM